MRIKTLLMAMIIGVFAFALTGCGSKTTTVTCVEKASESGIDMSMTLDLNFVKDKIKSVDFVYAMDLSKFSDEEIAELEKEDFCSMFKNSMDEVGDGVKDCKQTIKSKKLEAKGEIDVSKMTDDDDEVKTPEDAKKYFEDEGYTCTIK